MIKYLISFLIVFLAQSIVYATEVYIVDRSADNLPAAIHYHSESSPYTVQEELRYAHFENYPIEKASLSDIPVTKEDRKYWKLNPSPFGKRVVIDTVKKQADIDEKAAKKAAKKNTLAKACSQCTDEEWELLFGEL